jgi:predicted  nucleic acid-binding Zn-ribbon protein
VKENSDGNDTNVGSMENSIEEYIKNAEHFINSIKTDKEYQEENGWHGYYNKEIVELARMLEHILSDYKRVLKENELLRQQNISHKNNIRELKKVRNK